MLQLRLNNPEMIGEDLLKEEMLNNRQILLTAQEDEARYHDSQDWLDTETCAGEDVIRPDRYADYFDYLDNVDFYDINRAAFGATVKAHCEKLPVMTIRLDALNAYYFGQIFYFFQFACYLSCSIMGVNPFDQPGVEAYKKWMFDALGK